MIKKITKKQLTSLGEKIKNGKATSKEKMKVLKALNSSIESVNKMLEEFMGEMKKGG